MSNTCTAPGHPSCTITCEHGCIALYYEPDGPCKTQCSGSLQAIEPGKQFSIQISGVRRADLEGLLGSSRASSIAQLDADRDISFSGKNLTLDTFVEQLNAL